MKGSEYLRFDRYRSGNYCWRSDFSIKDGAVDILEGMPKSMLRILRTTTIHGYKHVKPGRSELGTSSTALTIADPAFRSNILSQNAAVFW